MSKITRITFPNDYTYTEVTTFDKKDFELLKEYDDSVYGIWHNTYVFIKIEDYKLLESE